MGRPSGKKEYSIAQRNRIITARRYGISVAQIAADEGVTPRAVYGIVQRYTDQDEGKSRPRSGRPPALSERDKRAISREITRDPFISNRDLHHLTGLQCSIDTLITYLRSKGIMHTHALTRPKLTPLHAENRLKFARQYANRSEDFWKRWIFSDETTIERGQGIKRPWVWAPRVSRATIISFSNI